MSETLWSGSVTLSDIAALTGVGASTVSRVIRQAPGVRASTRERVLAAIRDSGYIPDPALTALVARRQQRHGTSTHRGMTIAILTRQRGGAGARKDPAILAPLRAAWEPRGYHFLSLDTCTEDDPVAMAQRLAHRGVGGLILFRITHDPGWFVPLPWHRFAAVSLDAAFDRVPIPIVAPAHFDMVLQAWRRMHALGYRRIGAVIPDDRDGRQENTRRRAAIEYCHSTSPPAERVPTFHYDPLRRRSLHPVSTWLRQHRPEALLCLTSAELRWIRKQLGRAIPGAVLTGANSQIAGFASGHIIANEACRQLDMRLRSASLGLPEHPVHQVVSLPWINGASLGAR
ncbi:MAG: LacI family DNA-binding transcriptional regulator [Planctomycetota bacterium]